MAPGRASRHLLLSPQIWHHSFYQVLRVAPEEHPLMMTEPPLTTASDKEKLSKVGGRVVGKWVGGGPWGAALAAS